MISPTLKDYNRPVSFTCSPRGRSFRFKFIDLISWFSLLKSSVAYLVFLGFPKRLYRVLTCCSSTWCLRSSSANRWQVSMSGFSNTMCDECLSQIIEPLWCSNTLFCWGNIPGKFPWSYKRNKLVYKWYKSHVRVWFIKAGWRERASIHNSSYLYITDSILSINNWLTLIIKHNELIIQLYIIFMVYKESVKFLKPWNITTISRPKLEHYQYPTAV